MDSQEIHLVLWIFFKEHDFKNTKMLFISFNDFSRCILWKTHCIEFFYMQSVVIHVMSNICYICFRSSVKLSDSSLFKFKYCKLVYLSCCKISFSWIVHWFGKSHCRGRLVITSIFSNRGHWASHTHCATGHQLWRLSLTTRDIETCWIAFSFESFTTYFVQLRSGATGIRKPGARFIKRRTSVVTLRPS